MGTPLWELFAKEAREVERYTKIYGIKLIFYSKEGEPVSTLYADSGKVKREKGDLSALGNVVVRREGWTLKTRSLNWNNRKKKIWTRDEFVYEGKEGKVTGKGFESDPDLKHIVIKEKYTEEGEFEE